MLNEMKTLIGNRETYFTHYLSIDSQWQWFREFQKVASSLFKLHFIFREFKSDTSVKIVEFYWIDQKLILV